MISVKINHKPVQLTNNKKRSLTASSRSPFEAIMKIYSRAVVVLLALVVASPVWSYDKNQPRVLAAFRPLVEKSNQSIVRIFADGKRAALGTVVDAEGYILSKASELKGKLECQSHDDHRVPAEIVGIDRKLDLAMLKADLKNITPISWGNEDDAPLGTWLVTVGLDRDPLGIGVVSASSRAIQPANGALGVLLQDVPNGGGVKEVMPKSAAERAGILPGDIVTRVGHKEVRSVEELRREIFSYEPGEEVTLIVKRGDLTLSLEVKLGSFQQLLQGERADFQNNLGGPLSLRRAGFSKVVQHDTVVRPQDCGGPILNLDGKALGINIARAGRVETYALAASVIQPLVADFKAGKYAVATNRDAPPTTASETMKEVMPVSTTETK
jgi:serine protease Do